MKKKKNILQALDDFFFLLTNKIKQWFFSFSSTEKMVNHLLKPNKKYSFCNVKKNQYTYVFNRNWGKFIFGRKFYDQSTELVKPRLLLNLSMPQSKVVIMIAGSSFYLHALQICTLLWLFKFFFKVWQQLHPQNFLHFLLRWCTSEFILTQVEI